VLAEALDSAGLECPLHRGGSSLLCLGHSWRWRRRSEFRKAASRVAVALRAEKVTLWVRGRETSKTHEIDGTGLPPARATRAGRSSNRPKTAARDRAEQIQRADRNGGRPGKRGSLPTGRGGCQCSPARVLKRRRPLARRPALGGSAGESQRRGRSRARRVLPCGQKRRGDGTPSSPCRPVPPRQCADDPGNPFSVPGSTPFV